MAYQKRNAWLFAIMLIGFACNKIQHEQDGLVFSGWYVVRPPAGAKGSIAYGRITNKNSTAQKLQAAALDCAEETLLHETVLESGRATMVKLDAVELPAGTTVEFVPGRKHLMVNALRQPLAEKCRATFTINEKSYTFEIPFAERK